MEKSKPKQGCSLEPNLIIIEGFWGVRKTKVLKYLVNQLHYSPIFEPNHLSDGIKKNISQWYHKAHKKRQDEVLYKLNKADKIVMERSMISNFAFEYATTRKISHNIERHLKQLETVKSLLIFFLYASKGFITKNASQIQDLSVKKEILTNTKFYNYYMSFYRTILPIKLRQKVVFIKVNNNKGNFKKFNLVAKKVKKAVLYGKG